MLSMLSMNTAKITLQFFTFFVCQHRH